MKHKRKSYNYQRSHVAYVYLIPWMIGLVVFQLYPFLYSLVLSFTDKSMLTGGRFIGLQNYVAIFKDPNFKKSLVATLAYVAITVPLKLGFALFIAVLCNQKLKGIGFYRTIVYLPSVLGGSAGVAILWRALFSGRGLVNSFLTKIGLKSVPWLGSPNMASFTIALLAVWQFGSSMVLFLAALKQIPRSYYEAAKMDGAGAVTCFFKITLPGISPIIQFNLIMQTINAFQEFAAPYLITGGGPLKSTYLYSMLLYDNAFSFMKMGYASALSWIFFLIIAVVTLIIFGTSKFWVFNENE